MSGTLPDVEGLGLDDLKKLVLKLLEENAALRAEVAALRDEVARLKGLNGRPPQTLVKFTGTMGVPHDMLYVWSPRPTSGRTSASARGCRQRTSSPVVALRASRSVPTLADSSSVATDGCK